MYHYYGSIQIVAGQLHEFDGLIARPTPVRTAEDYMAVKEVITKSEGYSAAGFVLKSLTFLGRENEE